MPATVVVGMQYGDEGKGKIVDLLADKADYVVRFNGGDNAGHTIVRAGKTYKLHLVPSGVFHRGVASVIGSGVVVNPDTLISELNDLERAGVDTSKVIVSKNAHVILPSHIERDIISETSLSKPIGTTQKGIGPTYADRALRTGLRMEDIGLLGNSEWFFRLKDRILDTSKIVAQAVKHSHVLLEGAQGALLDIDYGAYPYVTSSNTLAPAAALGTGVGLRDIINVYGVIKAYTTRVGEGPFPTELAAGKLNDYLVEKGHEYGTTTGRRRRVGWLDLTNIAEIVHLNSINSIAITKLDVLAGIEKILVKSSGSDYITVSPWQEDISTLTSFFDLPRGARYLIELIETYTQVPVSIVSVGPDRSQTIFR